MNRRHFIKLITLMLFFTAAILLLTLQAGAETVTASDAASLQSALASAGEVDTVSLSDNIALTTSLSIDKTVTLNGNGYTVNASGSNAFTVNANLTLQNVTVAGNGSCRLLIVPKDKSPTLTFGDNTSLTAGAELPIYSEGSPNIVINGNKDGNGVSFSGNHGMYFVGGAPQITVSGKAAFDVVKCVVYALNTDGSLISINGTDVTFTGGETGIYLQNTSTPATSATVSLVGKLTMNMGKYGVEAKEKATTQITADGDVTINANYCLVSSSENAMHMTVQGNTVLKANKNPIHFDHQGSVTRNVRVAGNAKLSGEQIVSYGATLALTIAGNAEVTLNEIVLNTRSSSLTVTDSAKLTCNKNIRFAPSQDNTASFTASGNATVTTKGINTATDKANGIFPHFGIHFTEAGNGRVSISGNATVSTAIHTTVAQNTGTYSFEMTGGTLHSTRNSCVWTGDTTVATVKIRGGTLLSDGNYTMELKGAAGSAFDIYGGSVITKNGQAAIEAKGEVTVNIWGGYFEGRQKCCVRPCESATLNVYGGYFYYGGAQTSDGSTVRAGVAADKLSPTVNIYGGTFISTSSHGAMFNAIAPNGTFNIAENAVFHCQGGNAILVRSSGGAIFYEGAAHRYSSVTAPVMTYGAQIRLTAGSTGLRFATEYPKAAVNYFKSVADAGTLSFGTLIIPTDYLDSVTHFTLEALTAAGLTPLNLKAENGLIENEDGSITTRAAITNIKPENLGRDFIAVGYACYQKEGTLIYFYANYRELDQSRSIRRVAQLALEDVSEAKGGKYQYAVGDGTYSRYTKTQRDYMKNNFYDPAAEEKKTIDLYLIAGQSNAAGYSYFNQSFLESNPTYSTGYENVLYSGSAVGMVTGVPLSPNTVDVTPVRPGFGQLDTYIGAELGIADLLSKYYTDPNHKAGIIKYAVGSSRLRDDITGVSALGGNWYPPSMIEQNGATSAKLTGNLYRLFIDQVQSSIKDFRALGYEIHIKGVYWMQGESDRGHEDIYPELMRALITDMRSDLGALSGEDLSDMPFLVGEISASFSRDYGNANLNFIAMQQSLPTLLSDLGNIYVIPSAPLSTGTNASDPGHWTAEDMLLNGQMVGARFAELVLEESVSNPVQTGTPVAEVFSAANVSLGQYSHLAYAINSAPAGATVKLLCDVTMTSALNISNGNAVIIDGGGHTLTSRSDDHAVRIVAGDVTMNNIHIVNTSNSGAVYGFYLYDGASLTFNSGSVEANEYLFCLNQAGVSLTVNGGTFQSRTGANEDVALIVVGQPATINISGGTFIAANAASCLAIRSGAGVTATVTGGSFSTNGGKYCIYNADTASTLSIPDSTALTLTGATVSGIQNQGLGYQ